MQFQKSSGGNTERVAVVTRARVVRMTPERREMTPAGTVREPSSARRANRCNTSTSATQTQTRFNTYSQLNIYKYNLFDLIKILNILNIFYLVFCHLHTYEHIHFDFMASLGGHYIILMC